MRWRFLRLCRVDLRLRARNREGEKELRPASLNALHPDRAAVGFDDALCDRQPKAGAEAFGALGLPVRIEDVFQILCRDARTGIAHGEDDFLIVMANGDDTDHAARRRELERISDEV